MKLNLLSRRSFFQKSSLALTGAAVSSAAPVSARKYRTPLLPDKNRRIKMGVIGTGDRSIAHLNTITKYSDAIEIPALCDISQEQMDSKMPLVQGTPKTYTNYKDLLKHPGLNAVLIITPHQLHVSQAVDSLNAGLDVLIEKPMAMTVEECKKMNAAALVNNRILMVTEQYRYIGMYRKIKELIKAGEIGDVRFLAHTKYRAGWKPEKKWLHFFQSSGGGLISDGCHDLDLFYWLLDSRPVRVTGFGGIGAFPGQDTLDHMLLVYDFENGVKVNFGHAIFAPDKVNHCCVFGNKGRIEYVLYKSGFTLHTYKDPRKVLNTQKFDTAQSRDEMDVMYEDWIQSVRQRTKPLTDGLVMVESVRMSVAGQDAMRSGQVVDLFHYQ